MANASLWERTHGHPQGQSTPGSSTSQETRHKDFELKIFFNAFSLSVGSEHFRPIPMLHPANGGIPLG